MADIAHGTQFYDLPSCLVIDILLRLPLKALLICRYVRKDWTRLYFLDPYFIRRQLETSNIQFLKRRQREWGKIRLGCFVDEASTGNLRIDTLDFPCKLLDDRQHEWCVVNSCNGLLCLTDYNGETRSIRVCNPILEELIYIPVPNTNCGLEFHSLSCGLGFSAKNNQYKILCCIRIVSGNDYEYEWKIYTLGTGHWRSIEYNEKTNGLYGLYSYGLDFNTFLHGSLHWTAKVAEDVFVVQSFNFETERFRVFPLPELESAYIEWMYVALGVINGCLWASFCHTSQDEDGEMWAMKEYGVDKSWTMMLTLRNDSLSEYDPSDDVLRARHNELVIYKDRISGHDLLFTLNGEEMLTCIGYLGEVVCYNIKRPKRRALPLPNQRIGGVTSFNPSFVSLHDVARGEEVIGLSSSTDMI